MSRPPSDEKPRAEGRVANQGYTRWQEFQLWLLSWTAAAVVRTLGWTLRFRVEGREHIGGLKSRGQGAILSFWHNQILLGTIFWQRRNIMVMASPHFDGELTGRMIERFGFQYCSGSSSRGAVRALLQMKQHLAKGLEVAFTVDGPRGPVYRVQEGPLWLSRKSQCPIVCFHIEPRSYWRLKSWDGFRVPKPFTRCLVKIWEPIFPSEKEENALEQYQAEMDELRDYCERSV